MEGRLRGAKSCSWAYGGNMSDLNDLVSSIFSGGNLEAISQHLGVSNDETASGIAAIVVVSPLGVLSNSKRKSFRVDPTN